MDSRLLCIYLSSTKWWRQFDLNKFSCTAEERKAIIKIFLDKDNEWFENRLIKMIQPQNYSSFNRAIKEFEDDLTNKVNWFKKFVSPKSTTPSNENNSLPTTTPFMPSPSFSTTEAIYPTNTVILDTTNGTEPPTLEHPSGLLWLISIILLAIPIIGTTFFLSSYNKIYPVTPADSIKLQSTDVFPDEARKYF